MTDKRDQIIHEQLHAAWTEIDEWSNKQTAPSQQYISLLLKQRQVKMKRRLWLELSCLWLFAAILLAGGYWLVEQSTTAFLLLQAVLLLAGCIAVVWTTIVTPRRKRGDAQ